MHLILYINKYPCIPAYSNVTLYSYIQPVYTYRSQYPISTQICKHTYTHTHICTPCTHIRTNINTYAHEIMGYSVFRLGFPLNKTFTYRLINAVFHCNCSVRYCLQSSQNFLINGICLSIFGTSFLEVVQDCCNIQDGALCDNS